jgi:hypothetical protein
MAIPSLRSMRITAQFCSTVQHDVGVIITDEASDLRQANVVPEEIVCLEVGTGCTGARCPIGGEEPQAMLHRLVRHGLPTDQLTRVKGHCEGCGLDSELALVGENRASCLVCGTMQPWDVAL